MFAGSVPAYEKHFEQGSAGNSLKAMSVLVKIEIFPRHDII
jgi:hypothetical protein